MDDTADRTGRARNLPLPHRQTGAFHLGLGYSTLKRPRQTGKGPKCRRHGRTWRYHIDDIEAWSNARGKGGGHG